MTTTTQRQIADLLGYLIKDAQRHGSDTVSITVARCKTILADMAVDAPKPAKTPGFFNRLDKIHAV